MRCAAGENSGIEWTSHSFNPWVGCVKISPGCANCYAEAFDKRVGGVHLAAAGGPEGAPLGRERSSNAHDRHLLAKAGRLECRSNGES